MAATLASAGAEAEPGLLALMVLTERPCRAALVALPDQVVKLLAARMAAAMADIRTSRPMPELVAAAVVDSQAAAVEKVARQMAVEAVEAEGKAMSRNRWQARLLSKARG